MDDARPDLSFLAAPGGVADWRMTVLCDAAMSSGLLAGLPGTPTELAERVDLDAHGVRVVLDALTTWGVVDRLPGGGYQVGPNAPGVELAPVLHHHAVTIHRWSTDVAARLRGQGPEPGHPPVRGAIDQWLESMAVAARRTAPDVVAACLERFPGARTVLDLGGGHGEYSLEFARRGLEPTMQDRSEVIHVVRHRLSGAGVELIEGDFFATLPEGPFDVIWCAGITHTFSGARNAELFARLRPLTAPAGGAAIVTFLRARRPVAAIFAIQMLVNGAGGDTHSEDEYRGWLAAAGYRPLDVIDVGPGGQSALFAAVA